MCCKTLKELRKSKNLSQSDLAEQMYVHISTIQNWEYGKSAPSIEDMIKLTKIMDVDEKTIFDIFIKKNNNDRTIFDLEREIVEQLELQFYDLACMDDFIDLSTTLAVCYRKGVVLCDDEAFYFSKIRAQFDGSSVMLSDRNDNVIIFTKSNTQSVYPIACTHGIYIFEVVVRCPMFQVDNTFSEEFSQILRVLYLGG